MIKNLINRCVDLQFFIMRFHLMVNSLFIWWKMLFFFIIKYLESSLTFILFLKVKQNNNKKTLNVILYLEKKTCL